mgnify:CR=1 FL=1
MYINVDKREFIDTMESAGRANEYSRDGIEELYEILLDMEEDMGEEIELDPVAISSEFAEYGSFEEFQDDYPEYEDLDEVEMDTQVRMIDNESFIVNTEML